jgi:hypothetical protein
VVIHSRKLPQQFVDILRKNGFEVVVLDELDTKLIAFEKTLSALSLPFSHGSYSFALSGSEHQPGAAIILPALRVTKGALFIFLTDVTINPDLYGAIRKQGGGDLVFY